MARNTNKPNTVSIDVDKIEVNDDFLDKVGGWTSFYRCYPFIFAEDFLGVKLHPFQKILLYQMFHNDFSMFLASRGLGKSWLTAIFVVCTCVLRPRVKVIVSAGVKKQSLEVVNYIKALYNESECLRKSITYISDSVNDPKVDFASGSSFKVVVSNDNARGARSNVIFVDEARMVDLDIITTVLRPMNATHRPCKFHDLPEWKDYPKEENKEIYASSTYYCHHWLYDKFKDYIEQMQNGKSYFVADLPYQVSVMSGLKSKKQIYNQMTESTFNPTSWAMESCGRWVGQDSSAFFRNELLEDCRRIKKPFYEPEIYEIISTKNKKYVDMSKIVNKKEEKQNEVRLLFADIALASGSENDASVIGVMRLIPRKKIIGGVERWFYEREIPYMKAITGGRVDDQALEIKRLFNIFNCDYFVLDGQGVGQAIGDELSKPLTNDITGEEYLTPWVAINDDKWKERCIYPNAKPVMYVIHGSAQLNSDMHYEMLNCMTQKKISFVINEIEAKNVVDGIKGFSEMDIDLQTRIMEQYYRSSVLINEMINLKKIDKENGIIKLQEPTNGRKDHYMACAYANWIATTEFESKFNAVKKKRSSLSLSLYTPKR